MGITMRLSGGRAVDLAGLIAMVIPHAKRAGLVVQAGIQEAAPVQSGTLRRSFATEEPRAMGRVIKVPVGSRLVYAAYQNYRTRNRGYAQRGIKNSMARAQQVLTNGVRADARRLWNAG